MSRDGALWASILAGPIVWLASYELIFALSGWSCAHGKAALYIVSAIAFAISAGAGFLGWAEFRRLGNEWPSDGDGAVPRAQVMAVGGILLSGISCLVIVAQGIAEAMLGRCA